MANGTANESDSGGNGGCSSAIEYCFFQDDEENEPPEGTLGDALCDGVKASGSHCAKGGKFTVLCFLACCSFIVFFIPGLVHVRECVEEPVLPIWTTLTAFVPFFLLAFYFGTGSEKHNHKQVAVIGLLLYIGWFLAGNVWVIQTFNRNDPDPICHTDNLNFSIFVLVMCWLFTAVAIFLLKKAAPSMYRKWKERRESYLDLRGLLWLDLLIFICLFIPGLAHTSDCPEEPFVPAWCIITAFTPFLMVAFYFAITRSQKVFHVLAVMAFIAYTAWFLAGNVLVFRTYIKRDADCNNIIKSFAVFACCTYWVYFVIGIILFLYNIPGMRRTWNDQPGPDNVIRIEPTPRPQGAYVVPQTGHQVVRNPDFMHRPGTRTSRASRPLSGLSLTPDEMAINMAQFDSRVTPSAPLRPDLQRQVPSAPAPAPTPAPVPAQVPSQATTTARTVCGICEDNDIDSVLIPCGHSICNTCATQIRNQRPECPFCRNRFTNIQQLYLQ